MKRTSPVHLWSKALGGLVAVEPEVSGTPGQSLEGAGSLGKDKDEDPNRVNNSATARRIGCMIRPAAASGCGASAALHLAARIWRRPMRMLSDFRMRVVPILLVLAAGVATMLAAPGRAQEYPSRLVQLVVAYPPGGTGDIVAGLLADRLGRALGQPVRVENRAGASGAEGARSVARAAPDGYTLLLGQTAEIAVAPFLGEVGYDPQRDFQPIALVARIPVALVTQAAAPYSSVDELLRAARASQRGLLFTSAGPGTSGHLAGELLRMRSQGRLIHVPSTGAGPALGELLEGRVDFFFAPLPVAMPELRSGRLKILALSSAQRSLVVPNVPTIVEETGIQDFDISAWAGVFAPRGTPREIAARLNQEINQTLAQPEVMERLVGDGAELAPMSMKQFGDFVRSELARNADLLREQFCMADVRSLLGCFGPGVPG
jgi:tripartite-type tricarboxylate transporter receptor subunit TctC